MANESINWRATTTIHVGALIQSAPSVALFCPIINYHWLARPGRAKAPEPMRASLLLLSGHSGHTRAHSSWADTNCLLFGNWPLFLLFKYKTPLPINSRENYQFSRQRHTSGGPAGAATAPSAMEWHPLSH